MEETGAVGWGVEVEGDGALVAVVSEVGEGALGGGCVFQERTDTTAVGALAGLNLDHIGAEVAQNHAGELAAVVAQIQDGVGAEHGGQSIVAAGAAPRIGDGFLGGSGVGRIGRVR